MLPKLHLQDLAHEKPNDNEDENAIENVQRAAFAHQPVDVVEHQGHEGYVDNVFYSKLKKHGYEVGLKCC